MDQSRGGLSGIGPQTRVLLLGKNGQLGRVLFEKLAGRSALIAPAHRDPGWDFDNPGGLLDSVTRLRPDLVINAAGYTDVNGAEQHPGYAMQVNGEAPRAIAGACRAVGALFVQVSTDYVFDGTRAMPYPEDAPPHPLNAYGRSKLLGEQGAAEAGANVLIARTAWLYGAAENNFVHRILRAASQKEVLRVVDDETGTPTSALFMADALTTLAGRRLLSERQGTEIFHVVPDGAVSRFEWARWILEAALERGRLQKMPQLEAVQSADFEQAGPVQRPLRAVLSNRRLHAALANIPTVHEDFLASVGRVLGSDGK